MRNNKKGFTLLELLIVITILAVLSVAVIVIINPAETIKKARDTQRISDLSSIKTAIALYQSLVTTPFLATISGSGSNAPCKTDGATSNYTAGEDRIYYSIPTGTGGATINDLTMDGQTFTSGFGFAQVAIANVGRVDGTGWLPVDLEDISTGSPISNFPVDPTNSITSTGHGQSGASGVASSATAINANALVYRYVCDVTTSGNKTYEINATLESSAFTLATDADNKTHKDGGNDTLMYEVGTNLLLMSRSAENVVTAPSTTQGF